MVSGLILLIISKQEEMWGYISCSRARFIKSSVQQGQNWPTSRQSWFFFGIGESLIRVGRASIQGYRQLTQFRAADKIELRRRLRHLIAALLPTDEPLARLNTTGRGRGATLPLSGGLC